MRKLAPLRISASSSRRRLLSNDAFVVARGAGGEFMGRLTISSSAARRKERERLTPSPLQ